MPEKCPRLRVPWRGSAQRRLFRDGPSTDNPRAARQSGSPLRVSGRTQCFPAQKNSLSLCQAGYVRLPAADGTGDQAAVPSGFARVIRARPRGLFIAFHKPLRHGELTRLRHSLRDRISRSPLCNARGFARDVESAYRTLWESWCDDQRDGRNRDTTPAAP